MVRKEIIEKLEALKEDFKVLSCKEVPLKDSPFLTTKRYQYCLNNGTIVYKEKLCKNVGDGSGSAVSILPITKEGRVVVIVEPRIGSENGVTLGLPAGYLDLNESPLDAAARELKEETGYVAASFIPLRNGHRYYQDQGCSEAFNSHFLALDCEKVQEQALDADEQIKFMEVEFDDVLELADNGYINDANSLLTICYGEKVLRMK